MGRTYANFAVSNKTTSFTAKFLPSENYSLYGMLYYTPPQRKPSQNSIFVRGHGI